MGIPANFIVMADHVRLLITVGGDLTIQKAMQSLQP
jgi:hypothetical protein